jgi:hypothetical protein
MNIFDAIILISAALNEHDRNKADEIRHDKQKQMEYMRQYCIQCRIHGDDHFAKFKYPKGDGTYEIMDAYVTREEYAFYNEKFAKGLYQDGK